MDNRFTADEWCDIPETLIKLAYERGDQPESEIRRGVREALADIRYHAENPYDRECFMILYQVLERIARIDWDDVLRYEEEE